MHAFLYSSGTGMTDLGAPAGATNSIGYAINASGQVTGLATAAGSGAYLAFLYGNGKMMDLNTLDTSSPLAMYVTLSYGAGINDEGWIVSNGFDSRTGQPHAYLLIPLPSRAIADQIAALFLKVLFVDAGNGRAAEVLDALEDYETKNVSGTCAALGSFCDRRAGAICHKCEACERTNRRCK